jgi:hypothetical protein
VEDTNDEGRCARVCNAYNNIVQGELRYYEPERTHRTTTSFPLRCLLKSWSNQLNLLTTPTELSSPSYMKEKAKDIHGYEPNLAQFSFDLVLINNVARNQPSNTSLLSSTLAIHSVTSPRLCITNITNFIFESHLTFSNIQPDGDPNILSNLCEQEFHLW